VPVPAYRRAASKPVQALPASRLEAQADELLKLMARHGTAAVGAFSGYGCDATGELKILRALRARHEKPLDIVSIFNMTGMQSIDASRELLECVAHRKLSGIAAVRSGEGAFSRADSESLLQTVRALGMAARLETLPERDPGIVAAAAERGALSVSVAGPYHTAEIELLSESATFAILQPQCLRQAGLPGSGRELVDCGAAIALGSGLHPEGNATASMQTVIQLAVEILGLSLAEAISASTINAAWALGIGSHTGSLEHGKSGDLILLNASDYREIPLLAGTNLVHSTVKRGVVLFTEDFPGWQAAA
jgi:imidazolonepropionase